MVVLPNAVYARRRLRIIAQQKIVMAIHEFAQKQECPEQVRA